MSSNRHAAQIAGDKSGERSIVGSVVEDVEEDSQIDIDDDLSETHASYDANDDDNEMDQSSTYRNDNNMSLGPFSEDEDDDDDEDDDVGMEGVVDGEDDDGGGDIDASVSLIDANNEEGGDSDDDENEQEEEDSDDVDDDDDDDERLNISDNSGSRPQDYRNEQVEEAENMLQDLLEQFDAYNNVALDDYKDALVQLCAKWEQIHEQVSYEHEQQLEAIMQEKEELEIHFDELEHRQNDEVEIAKQEVMEQSQKIIMEEMKANADRERKSEEAIDLAVNKAVEEARSEMNEEFDIALSGMKAAQEELETRYEKVVKDTEIRVRDEVNTAAQKEAEVKIHGFMASYEEMKNQVVELTMELDKKELGLDMGMFDMNGGGGGAEIQEIIDAKDREIDELNVKLNQKNELMHEIRAAHEADITNLQSVEAQTKDQLTRKIATFEAAQKLEYQDKLQCEIETAVDRTKQEMNEEFEIILSGMKSTQDEIETRYKQIVEETKVKVRDEMQASFEKEAEHKMSAFMETYEEMKNQVVEMTMEMDELKANSGKFEDAELIIECKSQEIVRLHDELRSTVDNIQSEFGIHMQKVKDEHEEQLASLHAQTEMKDEEILKLQSAAENVESMKDQYELRIEEITILHQNEISSLNAIINEQSNELSRKELEFTESLALAKETVEKDVIKNYENQIKTIELENADKAEHIKILHEGQVKYLQEKYDSEMCASLEQHKIEKEDMQRAHDISRSEFKQSVETMEEEHISNVERVSLSFAKEKTTMQNEIERFKTENQNLVNQLSVMRNSIQHTEAISKQNMMKNSIQKAESSSKDSHVTERSVLCGDFFCGHGSKVIEEEKKEMIDMKLTELDSMSKSFSKSDVVDGSHDYNYVLPEAKVSLALAVKSGGENKENKDCPPSPPASHHDSAPSPTASPTKSTAATTPKKSVDHSFRDLSPLTIGSPTPTKNRLNTPQKRISPSPQKVDSMERERRSPNTPSPVTKRTQIQSTSSRARTRDALASSTSRKTPKLDQRTSKKLSSSAVGKESSRRTSSVSVPVQRTSSRRYSSTVAQNTIPSRRRSTEPLQQKTSSRRVAPTYYEPTSSRRNSQSLTSRKTAATALTRSASKRPARTSKVISPRTMSTKSSSTPIRIVDKTPDTTPIARRPGYGGMLVGGNPRQRASLPANIVTSISREETDHIRLMITIPITDKLKRMVNILRLQLTDDPLEATHVIAGDKNNHLRRTPKIMAALCKTSNILKAEWLEESYLKRSIVGCSHYLLLNDYVAENSYSFSMKQTLVEGERRRQDGGILAGWKILFCDGVAGNKAPRESDLHMIIRAAGGEWLLSQNIPVPISEDPTHVIVITSDPPLTSQIEDEKAAVAAEIGAGFFTTSWLFDCMMHQQLFGLKRGLGRL